jgi:hypothetical protein
MEHRERAINGAQYPPTLFALRDPATGVVRNIRDMTDEEIERHAKVCVDAMAKEQAALNQAMTEHIRSIIQVKGVMAALHYEAHRRSVTLIQTS